MVIILKVSTFEILNTIQINKCWVTYLLEKVLSKQNHSDFSPRNPINVRNTLLL